MSSELTGEVLVEPAGTRHAASRVLAGSSLQALPAKGMSWSRIQAQLDAYASGDADWRGGRTASLVYFAGDAVTKVGLRAYEKFVCENALGARAFPSLRLMESDLVSISAGLLRAAEPNGSVTSGGTESIMLAVKASRDFARARNAAAATPEILLPETAHPAFDKAAHYLGLRAIRVPVGADFRAQPEAMRNAITEDTILVVGSAPSYPHGVIDPIASLAEIALAHSLPLHVDACVGGFFLPFMRDLGYKLPPFDFSVEGVTSMSVDLHKYGYTGKGASVVLYRDEGMFDQQGFRFSRWPSGLYTTPTALGTRSGGAIAAAWAVLHFLGSDGYLKLVADVMTLTREYEDGIAAISDLTVWGDPAMSVFSFGSRKVDMMRVADVMESKGWYVNRQVSPLGIHWVVTPPHRAVLREYLEDLAAAARLARGHSEASGASEITYD